MGSVSHSLALFGRCLKFSGSCTYLPEVVVSSAGSSTTRAARHKKEKKKKKKKKIRAEFMTSVSYRPEVIRQQGRVVYEQIVDEGETRVDYQLIDNEAESSNCFSIHSHLRHKL